RSVLRFFEPRLRPAGFPLCPFSKGIRALLFAVDQQSNSALRSEEFHLRGGVVLALVNCERVFANRLGARRNRRRAPTVRRGRIAVVAARCTWTATLITRAHVVTPADP